MLTQVRIGAWFLIKSSHERGAWVLANRNTPSEVADIAMNLNEPISNRLYRAHSEGQQTELRPPQDMESALQLACKKYNSETSIYYLQPIHQDELTE